MVAQFSSPYAFARELVQNSIDAGATKINVRTEWDGVLATTWFVDDGCGMSRETIENRLLTLFASSKENDARAIGKYGVGFISVLAVKPLSVEVVTVQGNIETRVRLAPDHSYELEEVPEERHSGTSVALVHTFDAPRYANHVKQLRRAVVLWCRHVDVPLWLETDPNEPAQQINEKLRVGGLVSVRVKHDDERFALGIAHAGTTAHAAFYNRGLLLEQRASHDLPGLSGVHLKVSSPELGHTISREQVRNDAAYRGVLARARKFAKRKLSRRLESALLQSASRISAAALRNEQPAELARYLELFQAALTPDVVLEPEQIFVPLFPTAGGSGFVSLARLKSADTRKEPLWCVGVIDDFAAAFRETRTRIVFAPDLLGPLLARLLAKQRDLRWVHEHFVRCVAVEDDPAHAALCAALGEVLAAVHRPVKAVRMVRLEGVRLNAFALAIPEAGAPLAPRDQVRAWASVIDAEDTVFLDREHEVIRVALHKMRSGDADIVRHVAALLARLMLLEVEGPAGVETNERLLLHQLQRNA
jgi:molecular chaperone HtpG